MLRGSVLVVSLCMGGCVTIMKGSGTQIPLVSSPSGASVTLVGSKDGQIVRTETPAQVYLRHGQDYTATFEKGGFETTKSLIESTYSGWFFPGNLILGGIIGIIIDAAGGRVSTLSSDPVHVTLRPSTAGSLGSIGDAVDAAPRPTADRTTRQADDRFDRGLAHARRGNAAEARRLFVSACTAGNGKACAAVAESFQAGGDRKAAAEWWNKACARGFKASCPGASR
jgi:hypothetical protein